MTGAGRGRSSGAGSGGGSAEARLTIGTVLARLRPEFPDVSISKIRFLEAEGLVAPQRTPSGYRTFTSGDVDRLRYVLTAQRDRFWPLKVIRDALDALDRGLQPPEDPADLARPSVPAPRSDPDLPSPRDLRPTGSLRLTAAEVQATAGLDQAGFAALVTYGLLRPDPTGHFGEPALQVARAAGDLAAYGIEPRHLRPFKTAADREIGLVQQVVSPLRGRGGAEGDPTTHVLASCIALHTALVRAGLALDERR